MLAGIASILARPAPQDMSEPGKNRNQIVKIMSSPKRDRSPSVELVDTESPDERTESEQELSTSQNEPRSRQTSAIQNHVNKQQRTQSACHARKEPLIDILEVEVRISGSQNLLAIGFQCPGYQTVLLMVGPSRIRL